MIHHCYAYQLKICVPLTSQSFSLKNTTILHKNIIFKKNSKNCMFTLAQRLCQTKESYETSMNWTINGQIE